MLQEVCKYSTGTLNNGLVAVTNSIFTLEQVLVYHQPQPRQPTPPLGPPLILYVPDNFDKIECNTRQMDAFFWLVNCQFDIIGMYLHVKLSM